LRHIAVDIRKLRGIELVSAPWALFAVLNAAELVVLLPQIGFEYFKRRKEAENADVSECRAVTIGKCQCRRMNREARADDGRAANPERRNFRRVEDVPKNLGRRTMTSSS
jgi:hypothetical protein